MKHNLRPFLYINNSIEHFGKYNATFGGAFICASACLVRINDENREGKERKHFCTLLFHARYIVCDYNDSIYR